METNETMQAVSFRARHAHGVSDAYGVSEEEIKKQLKVVSRSLEYRALTKAVDGLESFLGLIKKMHA